MNIKPTEAAKTTKDTQPIPYLKTLYFFAVVLPYVFTVYAIFNAPNFSAIMHFTLSIVLGLAWHGVAYPLFEKKLARPYKDKLYVHLLAAMQYPIATLALHFLVTYLSAA